MTGVIIVSVKETVQAWYSKGSICRGPSEGLPNAPLNRQPLSCVEVLVQPLIFFKDKTIWNRMSAEQQSYGHAAHKTQSLN